MLSKYTRNFPVIKETKRFVWHLKKKKEFSRELNNLGVKCIFAGGSKNSEKRGIAFCIVHWNAPDYLLLNVKQLELIYPNSKIYVLDNGSQNLFLEELVIALQQFKNVTLLSAKPESKSEHTLGLQVLLNYSAMQQDEFSIFLDQDCILSHNIDELFLRFCSQKELLIAGARDYVIIPKQHNWLIPGQFLRSASTMIHPSLMILQPAKIVKLFGQVAFSPHPKAWEYSRDNKKGYEPYYGLSYRAQGHILYLETKMHNEIPLLTSYSYENVVYAYHAWYSSRTTFLSVNKALDGIPVSSLLDIRKKIYQYMEQIHKSTVGDLP
jgi:hypothetical protein